MKNKSVFPNKKIWVRRALFYIFAKAFPCLTLRKTAKFSYLLLQSGHRDLSFGLKIWHHTDKEVEKGRSVLIALLDNCGYFSLLASENSPNGSFLEICCRVVSHTLSREGFVLCQQRTKPPVSFALWVRAAVPHMSSSAPTSGHRSVDASPEWWRYSQWWRASWAMLVFPMMTCFPSHDQNAASVHITTQCIRKVLESWEAVRGRGCPSSLLKFSLVLESSDVIFDSKYGQ